MAKLHFFTLGCKVNQYDAVATEEVLHQNGHETVLTATDADIVVLQTCAVTARARQKSEQAARKFVALGKRVIVAGCGPQEAPEAFQTMDGVEAVFGTNPALSIADHLNGRVSSAKNPFPLIRRFSDKTRAHLKIEEGCDAFCS